MMHGRYFVVLLLSVPIFSCGESFEGVRVTGNVGYEALAVFSSDGTPTRSYFRLLAPKPAPMNQSYGLSSKRSALSASPVLSPTVRGWVENPGEDEVEVVLSVRSSRRLSQLPAFEPDLSRDDPYNAAVFEERTLLRQLDEQARSLERAPVVEAIGRLGGEVLSEFTVGNAVAARLTTGALAALLSGFPEIAAVTEENPGARPPSTYYIYHGRQAQRSDQYVDAGYDGAGYYIGLADTGTYKDHLTLSDPDKIIWWRDCAGSPLSSCTYYPYWPWNTLYDPDDTYRDDQGYGHGTGSANILVGNDNLWYMNRGVAPGSYVDSANVYSGTYHNTVSTSAVLRAFDLLSQVDDVIVANVAVWEDGFGKGTLSLAADDLYDEGIIVIAPVGNEAVEAAKSPGNAHKALGIGSYLLANGGFGTYSAGTYDYRIKPDILVPTGVVQASSFCNNCSYTRYGTCPAASFAGGAAVLLKDFYTSRGWNTEPGSIYSALIAFGDEDVPSQDTGGGNLEMGEISSAGWLVTKRYMQPGDTEYAWFYVPAGSCDIRAAVWWEEGAYDEHSIIDLELYRGSTLMAGSYEIYSVFQKVRYNQTTSSGAWWNVEIYSVSFNPSYTIPAYVTVHWREGC